MPRTCCRRLTLVLVVLAAAAASSGLAAPAFRPVVDARDDDGGEARTWPSCPRPTARRRRLSSARRRWTGRRASGSARCTWRPPTAPGVVSSRAAISRRRAKLVARRKMDCVPVVAQRQGQRLAHQPGRRRGRDDHRREERGLGVRVVTRWRRAGSGDARCEERDRGESRQGEARLADDRRGGQTQSSLRRTGGPRRRRDARRRGCSRPARTRWARSRGLRTVARSRSRP